MSTVGQSSMVAFAAGADEGEDADLTEHCTIVWAELDRHYTTLVFIGRYLVDKYWCVHQPHKSQLSGYLYLTQQNQQEYILHPAKNLNIIFFVGALRVSPMAMWPSDIFSQFVQMRRRSTRCVCGIEDHTAPFLILFASCQSVWWDCPRSQSLTMDRNMLEKGRICNFWLPYVYFFEQFAAQTWWCLNAPPSP